MVARVPMRSRPTSTSRASSAQWRDGESVWATEPMGEGSDYSIEWETIRRRLALRPLLRSLPSIGQCFAFLIILIAVHIHVIVFGRIEHNDSENCVSVPAIPPPFFGLSASCDSHLFRASNFGFPLLPRSLFP